MKYFSHWLLEPQNMPAPWGFDSWLTLWTVLFVALLNAVMLTLIAYRLLQVIQLSGYKIKGLFAWFKDTKRSYFWRLVMLSFLSVAAFMVTNVLLESFFKYKIMTYTGLLFYFAFLTVFVVNISQTSKKTPLKYTRRMNRLIVVTAFIIFIVSFALTSVSAVYLSYFTFGALGLTPILLPLFVIMAFGVTYPFENANNKKYEKRAVQKLAERKDIIKIGITGSYGKTSVKNILEVLLSQKYKVCASPYSYNTPLGLSKTILEQLKPTDEVFIAEMGARNKGDIAYLVQMIHPQYGLLTGVGNQHMSTFGTEQVLKDTKFELLQGVEKGLCVVNTESAGALELYERAKGEKIATNINDTQGFAYISNIKTCNEGSKFVLHIDNQKVSCETKLLGKHNISNILLCSVLAYKLGVTVEQIQKAIETLNPTAHRLAIVPSGNALTVIDDAYNGCIEGASAALEVLKEFSGKKIVITPGLVELGEEEFNSNFEFAIRMAKVCDYVIINGTTNYEALYHGLLFGGFDEKKIFRASTVSQSVEILNTIAGVGDVVLFENDLPDNYA